MRQNTGRRWSEATLGDEGDAFVASRRKNPCLLCQQQITPPGVTEILSGLGTFFLVASLAGVSCYALPLRRQRSSGSPHQARMAIGPSSKGLLRRLPVILPPLLGSSRWVFVAYCSVRHGGLPLHVGCIGFKFSRLCPYALFVISSQGLSLSYSVHYPC